MRGFNVKLILLVGLFAALVVKGGQLCSADGVQAMTTLTEKGRPVASESLSSRPTEDDFRGVSPLPALVERATPARKVVRPLASASHKPSKSQPATKDIAKKSARKE